MSEKNKAIKNTNAIIFHRSKKNAHETKITQEIFLLNYNRHYPHSESVEVIDYVTGDHELAQEINEIILDNTGTTRPIVIINSSIPAMEYDKQYDMYSRFCSLSSNGKIDLYLMDSRGGFIRR